MCAAVFYFASQSYFHCVHFLNIPFRFWTNVLNHGSPCSTSSWVKGTCWYILVLTSWYTVLVLNTGWHCFICWRSIWHFCFVKLIQVMYWLYYYWLSSYSWSCHTAFGWSTETLYTWANVCWFYFSLFKWQRLRWLSGARGAGYGWTFVDDGLVSKSVSFKWCLSRHRPLCFGLSLG